MYLQLDYCKPAPGRQGSADAVYVARTVACVAHSAAASAYSAVYDSAAAYD